jgi:addiction module HigA family antidote
MAARATPAHPGELLKKHFLDEMGITPYRLAKSIGVDQGRISRIIHGKMAVSAEMSLLLDKFFGLSEGYFLRLQQHYDLEMAKDKLGDRLETLEPA